MNANNFRIVTCEKCYNIPKIIFLNKNKVSVECQNCKESQIKDFSYFDKFIDKNIENEELFELPQCNYKENHEAESILYCFQCSKYICKDCLNIHNMSAIGKKHTTIKQKFANQYYCPKEGHEEYILDRYCMKCNIYLCSKCKCSHKDSDIIDLDNNTDDKIDEIKENIKKCENIIKEEENRCKEFISNMKKKIDEIDKTFKDYKKRNLSIISIYKLLIDNYEQMNKIRNYNSKNNLYLNNNFDLKSLQIYKNECISNTFNKLYAFYNNKNHIRTKEFADHFITEKYCDKIIKKCIFISPKLIAFMFNNDNRVYYINNNENNYQTKFIYYNNFIKDIYSLYQNKIIIIDEFNNLMIYNIEYDNNSFENTHLLEKINNINYVIIDLFNKDKFFMFENINQVLSLKYFFDQKNIYLLSKKNINCQIKNLLEAIKAIANNSKLSYTEKEALENIFFYDEKSDESFKKLIKIDEDLNKLFDEKNKNEYNKLRNKIQEKNEKFVLNSNYIYKLFNGLNNNLNKSNWKEEEKTQIRNIVYFNDIFSKIRARYLPYYVFNSKINNIYNYKNKFLIFMGEKYLLNIYSLKNKMFYGLTFINLLENEDNFNNFDISKITSDKIILNNSATKTIYFIDGDSFSLIKKAFNYSSNFVATDNYLLFDNIKDDDLQFSLIDLKNYSNKDNTSFVQLLNFKIDNNPPKLLLNENFKKFVGLYDNNQLCIIDYTLIKNIKDNNDERAKDISELKFIKDNDIEVIPSIDIFSSSYDYDYKPKNLFINNSYYCSKTNKNEYIQFNFKKEYYFTQFKMKYIEKYVESRPKKFKITVLDENLKIINYMDFTIEKKDYDVIEGYINENGVYLRFDFIANFGEKYICIDEIKFFANETYSINCTN